MLFVSQARPLISSSANTVPESSQTAAPSHPLTNGTPALDDSTTPSSPLREQPQAAATGSAEDTSPRAAEEQSLESQMPALRSAVPSSLTDLVTSFESVKSKGMSISQLYATMVLICVTASQRMASIDQIQKILENGRATAPQASDADKPKYYIPRNPWPTPSYYTQTPLPLLDNPAIFSQLEVETLFYIFYFYPGSYKQYLAAQELKKQSWRFHIKYMTWFMRHSEPQAVTEDYEQGVYVYFDWEGSWCQRKKADFRFEYRYLSEE
jgi:CCR4-NOT transcription complex subunit 3